MPCTIVPRARCARRVLLALLQLCVVRGRWLAAPNPALQELRSARGWQFVLHKQGVKVWKRTGCDDHANFAVKATMTMPCTAQQLASILTTRDYDVIRRFNPTIVDGADLEWRDGRRERITYILTKPVFPLRPRDFVCRVRRERIGDAELITNEAATHQRHSIHMLPYWSSQNFKISASSDDRLVPATRSSLSDHTSTQSPTL